jgi:predicted transcriptional regulator
MSTAELSPDQVTDFLQEHANHFPDLEAQAERVWRDGQLELEDLFGALATYLDKRHDVTVHVRKVGEMRGAIRRYDPATRTLSISEALRRGSRNFQLAFQVGLLENPELLDRLTRDPLLASDESRALGRVTLASYFAAAVLMPYEEFLGAAEQERYDLDVLQHRFRVNFEQACHRLCTLQGRAPRACRSSWSASTSPATSRRSSAPTAFASLATAASARCAACTRRSSSPTCSASRPRGCPMA